MPDISMCQTHECPLRNECYRYRAYPSKYQSYFLGLPDDGTCDQFEAIGERVVQPIEDEEDNA